MTQHFAEYLNRTNQNTMDGVSRPWYVYVARRDSDYDTLEYCATSEASAHKWRKINSRVGGLPMFVVSKSDRDRDRDRDHKSNPSNSR